MRSLLTLLAIAGLVISVGCEPADSTPPTDNTATPPAATAPADADADAPAAEGE